MKVNQSLLVKASILLVLSLSVIHAQWGIPFGFGSNPFPQQQFGFGGNPFSSGFGAPGVGGPFSFDQQYSLPFGSNIGQNFPTYGPFQSGPFQSGPFQTQQPNFGGNQPSSNQNNMRLRFPGQVYGFNPFYYVANLVAVDLDYVSHFASALTFSGFQGFNPFFDSINGMNIVGNQQKQSEPATSGGSTTDGSSGPSQADIQRANQEALALVFAKEVQIHVSHLVKQQDSYGPKGIGSVTTQLIDSADKLVNAANSKKWNDYQQEYNNLNNGLNRISYYGMQQNIPSFPQPSWGGASQPSSGAGFDGGNVKGSSFFPFLGNNGQFTMPQMPQAPMAPEIPQQFANMQQQIPQQFANMQQQIPQQFANMQQIPQQFTNMQQIPSQFTMPQMPQAPIAPEIPQQFANMQQQIPSQFSFPEMPPIPQMPQVPQVPQVANQQKAN